MAYVIHSINVTVNGGCHYEDVVADEEHHEYALSLLGSASFVLLGRGTYDLFAAFWPEAALRGDLPSYVVDFARELNAKPKYVLSSRDMKPDWNNTHLLRGPSLDPVRQLLSTTPTGRAVVFGSPSLGTSLVAAKLLDEMHLVLQPLIGAKTRTAYEGIEVRKALTLLENRPFGSGATLLRYTVSA